MAVPSVLSNNAFNDLSATPAAQSDTASADRFLKLLVAQMQHQDPLNPLDNAQVTSQMAQINTVTSIEKLNRTVEGLSSQFVQMQALQGASLVGRDVVVPGDKLSIRNGVAQGGFDLGNAVDSVKVEILAPSGQVVSTLNLGAQASGMHSFTWPAANATDDNGLRFRVVAKSGATNAPVTPLMRDRVDAINTGGDALTLELQQSGHVAYSTVKAFN